MDGLKQPPGLPWGDIRLFAMDVDGILTDGSVGVSASGDEVKFFSVLDGMGLSRLLRAGVPVAWISGRQSGATARRAAELKIPHVIQGRTDKLAALQELACQLGLAAGACLYMGDDDIDAPALRWAAIGVTVPEAMPAAQAAARHITIRAGGRGAVREICELLLAARAPSSGNSAAP
jgi:3-deoxy-D-manno-octulosonate 8-phosphate phosphatase (KDO 8-P phosphatase)